MSRKRYHETFPVDQTDGWGGGARFMLNWARYFYSVGNVEAGDRHALIAYTNAREAARIANRLLDA